MKKIVVIMIMVATVVSLAQVTWSYDTFDVDDPDRQSTWSEGELKEVIKGNVRPGLGKKSVVEYFGDAHCKSLLNQAKEAGFTATEAQDLVTKALVEKKTLKGRGPQALSNFYTTLDKKRAEKQEALALEIETLKEQVAKLQLRPQPTAAPIVTVSAEPADYQASIKKMQESVKEWQERANGSVPAEDPLAVAQEAKKAADEALQLAQSTSDGLQQTNARLDQMDQAWGQVVQETYTAIRQLDKKVQKVDAKVDNLAVAQTYISSSDKEERKKGLGLLYLARNGKFRTKNTKDARQYSTGLSLPNPVGNIDINKGVLLEEKKDSAPRAKSCGDPQAR